MTQPTIRETGQVPVTTYVQGYAWRCEEDGCGWVGTGHTAAASAHREASDHYWAEHGIAICSVEVLGHRDLAHPGHRREHVKGSDSLSKCTRCGDVIGK